MALKSNFCDTKGRQQHDAGQTAAPKLVALLNQQWPSDQPLAVRSSTTKTGFNFLVQTSHVASQHAPTTNLDNT